MCARVCVCVCVCVCACHTYLHYPSESDFQTFTSFFYWTVKSHTYVFYQLQFDDW